MADKPIIVSVNFEITHAVYNTLEKRGSNDVMGPGYNSWITGVVPEVVLSVIPGNPIQTRKVNSYWRIS